MTPATKLSHARTHLLLDQPFFGTLAMRLPLVEDPGIETAATNGKIIRYNPSFIDGLADAEIQGVLAHEVMHIANGHCWRRGGRDMSDWNVAADYAINGILVAAGLKLPQGCLVDQRMTQSAEEIYKRVHQPKPNTSQQQGAGTSSQGSGESSNKPAPSNQGTDTEPATPSTHGEPQNRTGGTSQPNASQGDPGAKGPDSPPDPGKCGAVEDAPDDCEGGADEAEWKVAVAQAAMAAKSQGLLPAGLARLVDELINPRVPWTTVLRDFIERSARNDYNWTRPNRRYLQAGFVLPSLISEELPAVVIAIDTSGSIGVSELNLFAAEVSAVLASFDTTIHLVWCDAAVAGTQELTRADLPLKLTPKGGGGTDFRPVFKWVEQQGLTPACLIYLTDMYGTFPDKEPGYPTLWVRTTDRPAPFGEVVDLK